MAQARVVAVTVADTAAAMAAEVALVAGATGLVGQAALAALLADKRCTQVFSLGRRPMAAANARHQHLVVDFQELPRLPKVDAVYIALGTTIKQAGSQAAFRAVDFDAILAVAKAARTAGAIKLGLVSAMGASPSSAVFYSRVKGEVEAAVQTLGYRSVSIVRPSMLAGEREALGQHERPLEKLSLRLTRCVGPLIPANYRAVQAADVACGLVQSVITGKPGTTILLSGALQGAQQRYLGSLTP